jgi:hypothetical protein
MAELLTDSAISRSMNLQLTLISYMLVNTFERTQLTHE